MKRMLKIAVVLATAVFGVIQVGAAKAGGQDLNASADSLPAKIWKRGLAIAPVTLNLAGKDRVLVGEGSYIVNTSLVHHSSFPPVAPLVNAG